MDDEADADVECRIREVRRGSSEPVDDDKRDKLRKAMEDEAEEDGEVGEGERMARPC